MARQILLSIGFSVLYVGIGLLIRRRAKGYLPPLVPILYFIAVIGTFMWLIPSTALQSGNGGHVIASVSFLCLLAFIPLASMADILGQVVSDHITSFMFDSSVLRPLESTYSKARARVMEGNINGALQEYNRCFDRDKKNPAPLIAAAMMLTKEGRFDAAAQYYRRVIDLFWKNIVVWADVSLRLAALYDEKMERPREAREIYTAVGRRARHLDYGRQATARLMGKAGLLGGIPDATDRVE